jgi:hypothetical protein
MSIFSAPSFYNQADQNIYSQGYSFIPQEKFRGGAFNFPTSATTTGGVTTLPAATSMNMGGGGGGGVSFSGTPTDLVTSFQKAVDDRTQRLENAYDNPSTAKIFGLPAFKQDVNPVDAGEYLAAGERIPQQRTMLGRFFQPQSPQEIMEQGYEPGVKLGILANLVPDKFSTLSRPDQAFITSQMGYTGPTIFGENTTGGSKDPFGLNVRSGYGNYAERVGIEATKLSKDLSGRLTDKYQEQFGITDDDELSYDPITGLYKGTNAAAVAKANQMTKLMRTKQQYYSQKTKERNEFREQEKARQEAAFQAQLNQQQREQRQRDLSTIEQAYQDFAAGRDDGYSDGSAGVQSDGSYNDPFDPGGGEKDGGFIDGTNRRMDFMMGGLANLVDIYD